MRESILSASWPLCMIELMNGGHTLDPPKMMLAGLDLAPIACDGISVSLLLDALVIPVVSAKTRKTEPLSCLMVSVFEIFVTFSFKMLPSFSFEPLSIKGVLLRSLC
ncbi:hypothetical protein RYX36_004441 [Vicia faba]